MSPRTRIGLRTAMKLAAAALVLWGVTLLLFIDVDKLASHW